MKSQNHCLDCDIKMESKLRIQGKWDQYNQKVKRQNLKSYLKEQLQQLQQFNNSINKKIQYIQNEQGSIQS